ncbi:MAG: polysaccharide biosynthesis protein, partial [Erysipelotrichaceae bacterium]|nr:polysaccharide biosynthesis protein [Erysipelotrichaceae bacterium]
MMKWIRRHRELVLFLLDVVMICLSYFLAFILRTDFHFKRNFLNLQVLGRNMVFIVAINLLFNRLLKVNNSLWKYASVSEVLRISISVVLANMVWFIIVLVLPVKNFIRSLPFIASLILLALELGARVLYKWFATEEQVSKRSKKAIIIGAGDAGNLMMRDLVNNDKYDAQLVGFFDDADSKQGKMVAGYKILGKVSDIPEYCKTNKVDMAFIAIVDCSKTRRKEIMSVLKECDIKTYVADSFITTNTEEKLNVRNVSIEDLLGRGETHLNDEEIKAYLHDKVIMVTGAGGSIGSELCRQVMPYEPKQLVLFDIYENHLYSLQQEIILNRRLGKDKTTFPVECLIGSVRDPKRLNEVMEQYHPEVLFHAAAHKHVPLMEDSPREAIKNNVFGTYNTIKACIDNKVGKFILISTDKAVNPTNVMGATKRMCELIVQSFRDNGITKIGAVRFGNVLGSNG